MTSYKDIYPEGYYKVRVIGNTVANSQSGNTYIKLKVEVVERTGKDRDRDELVLGGHRYIDLYTSDKCIEDTAAILKAAGFDPNTMDADQLSIDHLDHFDMTGFEFSAGCRHEEYNGKTYDRFRPAKNWSIEARNPLAWADNIQPPTRIQMTTLNNLLSATAKPSIATSSPSLPSFPARSSTSASNRVPF